MDGDVAHDAFRYRFRWDSEISGYRSASMIRVDRTGCSTRFIVLIGSGQASR